MKKSLAMISAAALVAMVQSGHAQDASRDVTRFAPLKADELAPAQKAWADAIAVPPRNAKWGAAPYRAYIRNPELAPKLSALSDYLRWNTTLPPRLSEFAIMITARNWTAQYEWAAHYPLALKAGLDVKILGDLSAGRRPENMRDDEAALYDLASSLYRDKKVTDAVYKAAVEKFGERGVMDIIGIIGYYDLVSMTLITAQVSAPADSTAPPLPALPK